MIYHECDQLGNDLQESAAEMLSEHGVIVTVSITVLEELVAAVASAYPHGGFEELLEHALDQRERMEPFQHAMQRKAYKKALGKVFGRRGAAERARMRAHRAAYGTPF
jgi:hypothetical protein